MRLILSDALCIFILRLEKKRYVRKERELNYVKYSPMQARLHRKILSSGSERDLEVSCLSLRLIDLITRVL